MLDDIINNINDIIGDEPQLFLDYDGTLVPLVNNPVSCYADNELLYILKKLNYHYEMFIVTGRSLEDLIKFIGNYNMIALHGDIYLIDDKIIKTPDFDRYVNLCNDLYKNKEYYINKFKNLRVYNKTGGLLFHMGNIKDENERDGVIKYVKNIADENSMDVYVGINIVELRIPGINKGKAIMKVRNKKRPAIIIGDDITDEEAFYYNNDAVTVKVGNGKTIAKHRIKYDDVRKLLLYLINLR